MKIGDKVRHEKTAGLGMPITNYAVVTYIDRKGIVWAESTYARVSGPKSEFTVIKK